jgi:terminase small subunit / prophage DNA-packing protein
MATQQELAAHLDITPRRVRQLIDERVLPPRGRNGWSLDECRIKYLRHLRSLASGHGGKSAETLSTERAQLAVAQRQRIQLWMRIKSGEYVLVTEAARQLDLAAQTVLENLRVVGILAAPDLAHLVGRPGEAALISAMQVVVDGRMNEALANFQRMNESGRLAQMLAPPDEGARP